MIVTKIERQRRHPNRVNVYLDDKFAFGIHEDVLLRFKLRRGDELTKESLDALQASEEFDFAKRTALRLINYRLRSENELRLKLREKEFHPQVISQVIEHLRNVGFLNDAEFARAFVHDTQMRKPTGRRLLHRQLRSKGISVPVIQQVLDEQSTKGDEQTAALKAASKIMKRNRVSSKNIEPEKQKKRLAQFLARRGFDWNTISPILRKLFGADSNLTLEP